MIRLPLSGYTILDLTRLLPGPYCTLILADLGAEVIKIEEPRFGDMNRWVGKGVGRAWGPYFMMLNRNKQSCSLNLKHPEGKKIFDRLVKKADVVVENFRPGVMDRLGLGYKRLKSLNKKIVYCSISGYGQRGKLRLEAGHDLNYQALSGILEMTGHEKGAPTILPIQIGDYVGGALYPAIGILTLLLQGKGGYLDCAMLDGAFSLTTMVLGEFLLTHQLPRRGQERLTGRYPNYNIYPTRGGRYFALASVEPKFWRNFCRAVGKEEWFDWVTEGEEPGFPTPVLASRSLKELKEQKKKLTQLFQSRTFSEWKRIFEKHPDCCCVPVANLQEAARYMEKERGIVFKTKGEWKTLPQVKVPLPLSMRKVSVPPPLLGEQTLKIVRQLGYKKSEILRLRKKGVV